MAFADTRQHGGSLSPSLRSGCPMAATTPPLPGPATTNPSTGRIRTVIVDRHDDLGRMIVHRIAEVVRARFERRRQQHRPRFDPWVDASHPRRRGLGHDVVGARRHRGEGQEPQTDAQQSRRTGDLLSQGWHTTSCSNTVTRPGPTFNRIVFRPATSCGSSRCIALHRAADSAAILAVRSLQIADGVGPGAVQGRDVGPRRRSGRR